MGPGPPKKNGDKGSSKSGSQRALNTTGQESSYAGSTAMSTGLSTSPTAVTEGSRLSGDGWNRKRYQREDEALWGIDFQGPGQRIKDAIAKAGSSARGLLNRESVKEENPWTYYMARNPPVNDLHPPVVSTAPSSREETRWMLQPPPSAKIMEGKERVNRNRADSDGSSRRGADGTPLSRQVTERLVDAKLQRGETPYSEGRSISSRAESRNKTPTSSEPKAQRHDRSPSTSDDEPVRRKRRPPPISVSTSGMSSRDAIEHIPIPSNVSSGIAPYSAGSEKEQTILRPALPTIASSSNVVPQVTKANSMSAVADISTSDTSNPRSPSPSQRLSPNVNAMPASIPSVESKFPGAATYRFPKAVSAHSEENEENEDPAIWAS
jgi:hypothetical protein